MRPCSGNVFPTPVGVFLSSFLLSHAACGLPHARGGVSKQALKLYSPLKSSPRPWGCFCRIPWLHLPEAVFPTPVGVFLSSLLPPISATSLPHARGGVSLGAVDFPCRPQSSPRPWGCFSLRRIRPLATTVFPTPVGVFLFLTWNGVTQTSLPHARGGVSSSSCAGRSRKRSSPRPWGCFRRHPGNPAHPGVFPTPVGVFLIYYESDRVF